MREDSEGKTDMRNMVKDLNLRAEGLRLQQTRAVGQIFVPDFSCSSHSAPPRKNPGVGVCRGGGVGGVGGLAQYAQHRADDCWCS